MYRISWTATGFSRKKILRGDGEEWTATSTHRNEFPRGDGMEGSKKLVILEAFFFRLPFRSLVRRREKKELGNPRTTPGISGYFCRNKNSEYDKLFSVVFGTFIPMNEPGDPEQSWGYPDIPHLFEKKGAGFRI